MSYNLLIGLRVSDEAGYQAYRDAMRPILEQYDGGFSYDFRVSDVLQSKADHEINRVFIIHFPNKSARESFFSDPAYKAVRKAHFEPAIAGSTVLATFES